MAKRCTWCGVQAMGGAHWAPAVCRKRTDALGKMVGHEWAHLTEAEAMHQEDQMQSANEQLAAEAEEGNDG